MVDNLAVTPGTGATVGADLISTVLYQRVKLIYGDDGVNSGDVSTANPFPCNVNMIGGASFALGQQLAAASLPVVLTASQLTTLTPLTTAPIPASNSSSAYAHTSPTTAYATGQLWANNATAGSVTFGTVSVAKANDQAFSIIGAILSKSGNSVTNAVFRVHLFNAAPTTAVADYGTFAAALTTTIGNYLGYIDFNTNQQFAGNAQGVGQLPMSAISGIPVSGAKTVVFVVEVRAAYTPLASETLTLTLITQ